MKLALKIIAISCLFILLIGATACQRNRRFRDAIEPDQSSRTTSTVTPVVVPEADPAESAEKTDPMPDPTIESMGDEIQALLDDLVMQNENADALDDIP
jgi:hypothetical protein